MGYNDNHMSVVVHPCMHVLQEVSGSQLVLSHGAARLVATKVMSLTVLSPWVITIGTRGGGVDT